LRIPFIDAILLLIICHGALQKTCAFGSMPIMEHSLTVREEANALTCFAFRNGFIEKLHAGKYSELLEKPGLSRITDSEMKKLIVGASSALAEAERGQSGRLLETCKEISRRLLRSLGEIATGEAMELVANLGHGPLKQSRAQSLPAGSHPFFIAPQPSLSTPKEVPGRATATSPPAVFLYQKTIQVRLPSNCSTPNAGGESSPPTMHAKRARTFRVSTHRLASDALFVATAKMPPLAGVN
jgi:hypothetical protein